MILLFVESRIHFENLPFSLILEPFKRSINYEYIVYRNKNLISCFSLKKFLFPGQNPPKNLKMAQKQNIMQLNSKNLKAIFLS